VLSAALNISPLARLNPFITVAVTNTARVVSTLTFVPFFIWGAEHL
jgi:hypothetical protein